MYLQIIMILTIIAFYLDIITSGTVGTIVTTGDTQDIDWSMIIGFLVVLLFYIGHMLDRWLNQDQYQDIENYKDQE